jgi:imidazole glycerol-phosphate synthase subunit HisH
MEHYDALLIDAGTGNLYSVYNVLTHLGFAIKITTQPADLVHSSRILLPGVGAFGKFMQGLAARGLIEPLQEAAGRGDPLLGICVGMQALFEIGEEMGQFSGLGLLPGRVTRFSTSYNLKVPHTGWNNLIPLRSSPLFTGLQPGVYTYFNHSFYCSPASDRDVIAQTCYGENFASMVQRDNLFGVQFHPEKSQRVGMQILSNFMGLYNVKIYDLSRH